MVSNIHDATFSSNTFSIFCLFFFLPCDPESVASLLDDQYFNVLRPSLETLCEVPFAVDVD